MSPSGPLESQHLYPLLNSANNPPSPGVLYSPACRVCTNVGEGGIETEKLAKTHFYEKILSRLEGLK